MPQAKKTTSKKVISKVNSTVDVRVKTKNKIGFEPMNVVAMVIVLAIFGFIGFFAAGKSDVNTDSNTQAVAAIQAIAYDGEDGQNALDLLKSKAEIQTQDSSIGVFVISINGISNSEDHFWMFYVNGELAQVSADQYTTKNGDKIEWRYDQFN